MLFVYLKAVGATAAFSLATTRSCTDTSRRFGQAAYYLLFILLILDGITTVLLHVLQQRPVGFTGIGLLPYPVYFFPQMQHLNVRSILYASVIPSGSDFHCPFASLVSTLINCLLISGA